MAHRGQEIVAIHRIVFRLHNRLLAKVVATLQDRPHPLADQSLRSPLDARLGLLCLGVEHDHLADSAHGERILVHRQTRQSHEDVALDVVGWKATVLEWLEEEAHSF